MLKIFLYTFLAVTCFLMVRPVLAQSFFSDPVIEGLNYANYAGYETDYRQSDLRVVVTKVIKIILSFLGLIAIVIVLWGGFRWMTAGGSEEKVRSAKGILTAGVIGLAIILLAYAIATFVSYTLANVVAPVD